MKIKVLLIALTLVVPAFASAGIKIDTILSKSLKIELDVGTKAFALSRELIELELQKRTCIAEAADETAEFACINKFTVPIVLKNYSIMAIASLSLKIEESIQKAEQWADTVPIDLSGYGTKIHKTIDYLNSIVRGFDEALKTTTEDSLKNKISIRKLIILKEIAELRSVLDAD